MRTIPEIRKRLREIAWGYDTDLPLANELRELADAMHRRPCVRRARKRMILTDAKIREIKDYAEGFPDSSYHEIAVALGVNAGRVSEVIAGKRQEARP